MLGQEATRVPQRLLRTPPFPMRPCDPEGSSEIRVGHCGRTQAAGPPAPRQLQAWGWSGSGSWGPDVLWGQPPDSRHWSPLHPPPLENTSSGFDLNQCGGVRERAQRGPLRHPHFPFIPRPQPFLKGADTLSADSWTPCPSQTLRLSKAPQASLNHGSPLFPAPQAITPTVS